MVGRRQMLGWEREVGHNSSTSHARTAIAGLSPFALKVDLRLRPLFAAFCLPLLFAPLSSPLWLPRTPLSPSTKYPSLVAGRPLRSYPTIDATRSLLPHNT